MRVKIIYYEVEFLPRASACVNIVYYIVKKLHFLEPRCEKREKGSLTHVLFFLYFFFIFYFNP